MAISSLKSLSCLRADIGMRRVVAPLLDRQLGDAHRVVDGIESTPKVQAAHGRQPVLDALTEESATERN